MNVLYLRPFAFAAVAALACRGVAAEPADDTVAKEAHDVADAISVSVLGEGGGTAKRVEAPVLRFGDPARNDEYGTFWIWTHDGRPVSLMEMYFKTHTRARIQVVASLTKSRLDLKGGEGFVWRPATGIEYQMMDFPPPAERAEIRLRQMKTIARRFKAHEFWDPDNSRFELRLLAQPVFHYQAGKDGVLDGAVFLLSHDLNPEIALLIEAEKSAQRNRWRFAAARIGHAEMHLSLDDEEVWKVDRVDTTDPDESYHLFYYKVPVRPMDR